VETPGEIAILTEWEKRELILYRNSMNYNGVWWRLYYMTVCACVCELVYSLSRRCVNLAGSRVRFWFSKPFKIIVSPPSSSSFPKGNAQYARNLIDFHRDFVKPLRIALHYIYILYCDWEAASVVYLCDSTYTRMFLRCNNWLCYTRFVCLHQSCKQLLKCNIVMLYIKLTLAL